jgi:hypothetical protein
MGLPKHLMPGLEPWEREFLYEEWLTEQKRKSSPSPPPIGDDDDYGEDDEPTGK